MTADTQRSAVLGEGRVGEKAVFGVLPPHLFAVGKNKRHWPHLNE